MRLQHHAIICQQLGLDITIGIGGESHEKAGLAETPQL